MKFKNSYILLIAISILLLISIGSVCASDDNTTDSDTLSTADGTSVVLEAGEDTGNDNSAEETTQEKVNTSVVTEKESYKIGYDEDKDISVKVNDNESNEIEVNETNLTVFEKDTAINFKYNNSKLTILDKLSVGNHNLTINYLGNANYTNSSKIILLQIFGNNTINTDANTIICDGKTIEIPVTISNGIENITLNNDDFKLTLIYRNETGNITNKTIENFEIIDGKIIKFDADVKLLAASLIINYTNATEPKTVGIKVNTTISAQATNNKVRVDEDKNITINLKDGQGNLLIINKTDLKVLENGESVSFKYNNSMMTVTLGEGVHNLTIIYNGDDTYDTSNTTVELKVYGNNTINVPESVESNGQTVEIPISIFDGAENITIVDSDLTLNLTYINKTGNVTSKIITANVENGKIKFDVNEFEWIKSSLTINYVNSNGAKTVKIYLSSSVELTPDEIKYREGETNNITIIVKNNNGEKLNITKDDLQILDNGENIYFTYDNSIINVNLTIGVHNLTVIYKGNDTYNTSSQTIELKVYGNATINPDESVILNKESEEITITLNLFDGADSVNIELDKLNVTLFYTLNGETKNITIETISINGQNITFKVVDEDFESAYVNIKYKAENNLTAKTTIKVNTTINTDATYYHKGESEIKNLTIKVKGDNDHIINITKDNIQILNNGKALNIQVNNSVITINETLKIGNYNLIIRYLGTDTFLASERNINLTIYGINATTSTNINSTKKGEVKISVIDGNETVNITETNLNVTVTFDGNKTIELNNFKFENGTLKFTLDDEFSKAILTIKYNNTEVNVTLNRIYNIKVIPKTVNADYQDGSFTFLIVDIDDNEKPLANKTVSVSGKNSAGTNLAWTIITGTNTYSINSNIQLTTDKNGIATLENKGFYPGYNLGTDIYSPVGEYNMTIDGSSDLKGSGNVIIKINKATVNMKINTFNEYYGTTKKVTIVVTNAKTGKAMKNMNIVLSITGATLNNPSQTTNSEGKIELGVSGLGTGKYTIKLTSNDTNVNTKTVTDSFTIKKIPVTISAKNAKIYYNSGTTASVKILDKRTNKPISNAYVVMKLDSIEIKGFTDSKGKISFSTSLKVGSHKLTVTNVYSTYESNGKTYLRDMYDYSKVTKTITVIKANAKITAKKVTTYYKAGKYFTVKLTNSKTKKAIFNAKVNIKLVVSKGKYYNYNGYTGTNGQLKLLLDSLNPGTYKVIVTGADNKDFTAKQVTTKVVIKKAPTKFIAKKLTAKKGKNKYFKITVKNKKTKKIIPKVKIKVKVYTGKKAKTYTLKTNAKGIAKLSVKKLKVGKHKVIITSANKYCVAKKTKSLIKIKK